MDNDYPRMLLRFPAQGVDTVTLPEGTFGTLIVPGATEHDAARAEGWCDTSPDALAAHADQIAAATKPSSASDNAPPTRAELEAKATELGIAFTAKTSDKKLGDQIAAALEE